MRVAVLIKRYVATGGSERYGVEITRRLVSRGFQVDLYCREWDESLVSGLNAIVQVPDRGRFSSVASALAFAADTAALLKNKNYDVVHSHERGYAQDILTIHTFTWRGGTREFSPLKRFFRFTITPRHHLYNWLEKRQMATPWLVAVSHVIKKEVTAHYPHTGPVEVISPGVDVDLFSPAMVRTHRATLRREAGFSDDDLVILFIGNEFRRKGLDHLIPALGEGMVLLVAGHGENLAHYQQLAGGSGRVRFLGLVKDVRPLYAMADVVALPSLREGFGMVLLEAMACGLPIVVREGVGAAELVVDGVNGLRFDETAILPSLLNRLKNKELRSKLGHAARLTSEGHTWERQADRYAALMQTIATANYRGVQGGSAPLAGV